MKIHIFWYVLPCCSCHGTRLQKALLFRLFIQAIHHHVLTISSLHALLLASEPGHCGLFFCYVLFLVNCIIKYYFEFGSNRLS